MALQIRNVTATGSRDTLTQINTDIRNIKTQIEGINPFKDTIQINDNNNIHMTGHVGIKKESSPDYTLDVDGAIRAHEVTAISDKRLKMGIEPLGNVLSKLNELQAYTFYLNGDETNQKKIGLMAQDLLNVFPELVTKDEKGFFSINYANFTAILLNACNQLSSQNNSLANRLQKIEEKLSHLL